MNKILLSISIASVLLTAPLSQAQNSESLPAGATPAHPATPVMPVPQDDKAGSEANAKMIQDFAVLEDNMNKLQAQALKITGTTDLAERQTLISAHFISMQDNMEAMQAFMTSMHDTHAPAMMPAGAPVNR